MSVLTDGLAHKELFERTHAVLCAGLRLEAHNQMRTVMTVAIRNHPENLSIILPITRRILDDHNILNVTYFLKKLDEFSYLHMQKLMRMNRISADPEAESIADLTKFFVLRYFMILEEVLEFK